MKSLNFAKESHFLNTSKFYPISFAIICDHLAFKRYTVYGGLC